MQHNQQQQQQLIQQQMSQSQTHQQQHQQQQQQQYNERGGFFNMFFQSSSAASSTTSSKSKPPPHDSRVHSSSGSRLQPPIQAPVKLEQVPNVLSVTSIPQSKEFEIELLEALLDRYFSIVRKTVQDMIPKIVMYFMVSKSKQDMQNGNTRGLLYHIKLTFYRTH